MGATTSGGDEAIGGFDRCETAEVVARGVLFKSATGAVGNRVGIRSQIKPETDSLNKDVGGDGMDLE
jgi:hypothetical protein